MRDDLILFVYHGWAGNVGAPFQAEVIATECDYFTRKKNL